MERLHARYPFLAAAREAVDAADVDLAELVARDAPAVDRAVARIESAIRSGTVGDPHRRDRVELLSYPVARVLVSLVDQPALTRTYARAEAETAMARLRADRDEDELKSARRERMSLDRFLREFDIAEAVTRDGEDYRLAVGPYLRLAGNLDGDAWRLVNRRLGRGVVPVDEDELLVLLREAVADRVASGLPLSVPDSIADSLDAEVETVHTLLADRDLTSDIDVVRPGLFPPCMDALLERVRAGETLPEHARFALVTFLSSIGMAPEDVATLLGVDDERAAEVTRQAENVGSGDAAYAPPSCDVMDAYGICVNQDDLCAEIAHPLTYYERRVADDA